MERNLLISGLNGKSIDVIYIVPRKLNNTGAKSRISALNSAQPNTPWPSWDH